MRTFQCTCGQPLFFDNMRCLSCGADVAYDPSTRVLGAVRAAADGSWEVMGEARAPAPRFLFCEHRDRAAACNWLVAADEGFTACLSCRLTRTIPDLSRPRNARRLASIETAKRRVLFALQGWGLPIRPRGAAHPHGLAFDLLEAFPGAPVLTGHDDGVITLNVEEADDDFRERHREALSEPYRTVLGHLRHELGHHYWNVLVRDGAWLPRFRALFGDERADYGEAVRRHYAEGPPADWPSRFLSGYASVHPWEDWAETWTHYLHLRSTLQTVASFGLETHRVPLRITPFTADVLHPAGTADEGRVFLEWINAWVLLTAVLNETARSMGQPDLYPFVLNRAAVTKLHFVHCVVGEHEREALADAPAELGLRSG